MSSIALTTAYQPSPSCLSDVYFTTTGVLGYMSLGPPQPSQCFPSGWKLTSQYFSPGICPSGYAAACEFTNGAETQATCCPSYYSCQTSTNWPQYSTLVCTVEVSDLPSSLVPASITSGASVIPIGLQAGGGINAFGLSIRWKAGDFTTTSSSSAPSTSPQSSSSIAQSASTPSSSSTSPATTASKSTGTSSTDQSTSSTSSSGQLSTGAKAGIGVGAAIGALAIFSILVFYAMRYRRAPAMRRAHELGVGGTSQWFPLKSRAGTAEKQGMANNGLEPVEIHTDFLPPELHGEAHGR